MIRSLASLLALCVLAACGADGAPERPEEKQRAKPGISISGTASIGVRGGHARVR